MSYRYSYLKIIFSQKSSRTMLFKCFLIFQNAAGKNQANLLKLVIELITNFIFDLKWWQRNERKIMKSKLVKFWVRISINMEYFERNKMSLIQTSLIVAFALISKVSLLLGNLMKILIKSETAVFSSEAICGFFGKTRFVHEGSRIRQKMLNQWLVNEIQNEYRVYCIYLYIFLSATVESVNSQLIKNSLELNCTRLKCNSV